MPDTTQDPRFAGNAMGLGFYAGTPVTVGGQRIGTLCVAGEQPHTPSADDLETLRVLASAVTAHVELARRERERADEATMLRRLGEATSRLARVSDASEFETELCAAACELAGADAAVLWTAVPGGMLLAMVDVGLGIAGTELPPGHGAGTRVAFDRGEREYRTRAQGLGLPEFGAGAFQPLAIGDQTMGVLTVLWRNEPPELPERELQLIELLSGEAAVAIQRTATLSELEKLTRVDALTGIGNRRAFDEQLARELKRAEREGTDGRARDVRPRPLQGLQRRPRPPRGRPAAGRRGRGLGRLPARHRQPRPLRRRGVRAGRARLQRRGGAGARGPAARGGARRRSRARRASRSGTAPRPPRSCWRAPTPRSTPPRSPAATRPASRALQRPRRGLARPR